MCDNFFYYSEIFDSFAAKEMHSFVIQNMKQYFELVQNKVDSEQDVGDTSVVVKALDRFHRRLQAMNTLCTNVDFGM